ncbi:uncharacterized protein [Equus caballus]
MRVSRKKPQKGKETQIRRSPFRPWIQMSHSHLSLASLHDVHWNSDKYPSFVEAAHESHGLDVLGVFLQEEVNGIPCIGLHENQLISQADVYRISTSYQVLCWILGIQHNLRQDVT